MKILYVSYDGMTDALGRSQVIPYLLGLSRKGHLIHVVSCEKRKIPTQETQLVADIFEERGIQWSPLTFSSRPPWLSKLLDVIKIKRTVDRLYRQEKFDIVHCRSYIASLAGLDLSKRYNVKFVFDMRGFWANERIEGDMWNLRNPLYRLIYNYFKRKEKEFFHHADAVISLTHNGKEVIRNLFGEKVYLKTTVIPCCVDTDFFDARAISSKDILDVKVSMGFQPDDFIISYLGSIGTWYMTDEMLVFYKKLTQKLPNARFFFISGDEPDFILHRARMQGIDDQKIIIARATRAQVPLYLSLSAISIFFIRPVFSKRASSPTKQAEIMSMGIPLICNSGVGDTDMLLSDEKSGIVLKDFTEEEFNRAIARIDEVLKLDPSEIRGKAISYFNLKDGVEKYDAIYRSIAI
jgi:glycosyltransferase involved in cell wall biosynthesis